MLTTKGIMMHGGMNSQWVGVRAGIHCHTVEDIATVLDAIKGYKSDDMYTAIAKALIPDEPYTSVLVDESVIDNRPLASVRLGVVREFIVKHKKNDEAIIDQINNDIKTILRNKLGAVD